MTSLQSNSDGHAPVEVLGQASQEKEVWCWELPGEISEGVETFVVVVDTVGLEERVVEVEWYERVRELAEEHLDETRDVVHVKLEEGGGVAAAVEALLGL